MNDEKNLQAGARGSHIRSPVCCVMPSHHYSKFVLPYKYAKNKTCVTKKCPVCVLVVCCLRMMRLAGPCGQGEAWSRGVSKCPEYGMAVRTGGMPAFAEDVRALIPVRMVPQNAVLMYTI